MNTKTQFSQTLVLILLGALQLVAQTVNAQDHKQAHLYAGSALCNVGEIGLVVDLEEKGPLKPQEFDDPCRSGQGPCNDNYKRDFQNTRHVDGTVSLFPIAGNSEVLAGTYMVSGTVLHWGPNELPASASPRVAAIRAEELALSNRLFSVTVFPDDEKGEAEERLISVLEVHTYIDIYTGARETTGSWNIHSSELKHCDMVRLSPLKRN